jgi:hypothetical protein
MSAALAAACNTRDASVALDSLPPGDAAQADASSCSTTSGPSQGRIVNVSTFDALRTALTDALSGDVITLAPGTYQGTRELQIADKQDVTLRGDPVNPETVIIRGAGFAGPVTDHVSLLAIYRSQNIRIEGITFEESRQHGIQIHTEDSSPNYISQLHIEHCRFRNIGERAIKGSTDAGPTPDGRLQGGSIRFCSFENTQVPGTSGSWSDGGNYITAIDVMRVEDFTFSDNTFTNINGASGGGRGCIFIWNGSSRVTIERNTMINCDRGIGLGNPGGNAVQNIQTAVVRNNVIVAGADSAIELSGVDGAKIYNNTIWRSTMDWRGLRAIDRITNVDVANNLICANLQFEFEGSPTSHDNRSRNNLFCGAATYATGVAQAPMDSRDAMSGYFANPSQNDFHLTTGAAGALDTGLALVEVPGDFDNQLRNVGLPDIGADEFGSVDPVPCTP